MFFSIITMTNKESVAEKISKYILEKKFSPCIQVTNNIKSQFIWKDNIDTNYEYKIEIKTVETFEKKIINIIEKLHNYEVPEIIKVPLDIKNESYKEWFLLSINKKGE